jgi:hypothetical protein
VNAKRYARLRRIRQHTHVDADADTYGSRFDAAVDKATADSARAKATDTGMAVDAAILSADAADAVAVAVGFYL